MKKLLKKQNKGFVVLFTVLIASVMLAMAVGISNISLKQIVLTASATDANKSFYAADTGIECALFYDLHVVPSAFIAGNTITCNGVNMGLGPLQGSGIYSFSFDMQPTVTSDKTCASVTVYKDVPNETRIVSKGLNLPCGSVGSRAVERAIEVTY